MGMIFFVAAGLVTAWMETTAPFAHEAVRAKAIAAAIVLVPFALLWLWLDRRARARKAAAAPRPAYPFAGQQRPRR